MIDHNPQQQTPETRTRFTIEKLEERIAPAKGGVAGKPLYHYPPGQSDGWWWDCKGGGPNKSCPL